MEALKGAVDKLIGVIKRIGGTALAGMMVMTCLDVVFRAFGKPIFGAVEMVSFMATMVLACAMPLTEKENGHVGVDLLMRRCKRSTRKFVAVANNLVTGTLFGLVSWQMFLYAGDLKQTGEVSMSLQFPSHYLVDLVAVAFGVLSLVIFAEMARVLRSGGEA